MTDSMTPMTLLPLCSVRRARLAVALLLAASFCVSVAAQGHLYTFRGDSHGDFFGDTVDMAGDVDRDGYSDVIVGAVWDDNNGSNSGSARVFSGKDGRILYTFIGDAAGDMLGVSAKGAGDVNGDGYSDLIVGASQELRKTAPGYARVFSGRDGKVLYTFRGEKGGDWFGNSVNGAGDVNRDGYADLIVGAPFSDKNGMDSGTAFVFSGKDGKLLYRYSGDSVGDLFGNSVSGALDVNRDGHADLAVGAMLDDNGGRDSGSLRVFSGKDGKILYTVHGVTAGGWFGFAVAAASDVNGDGHPDIVVGAPFDNPNGQWSGSASVVSGKDGKILYRFKGQSPGDGFGRSVSGVGDIDADGHADIIVGAHGDDNNGQDSGSARVLSGKTGRILYTLEGDSKYDQFGVSVGGGGDVNADGRSDIIVGARLDGKNARLPGSAFVISGVELALTSDTHLLSLALGGAQAFTLQSGRLHGGKLYIVLGSMSGTRPGLKLGALTLPLNPDAYFGLLLANPNSFITRSVCLLDTTGKATAALRLPGRLPPSLLNVVLHHAYAVIDLTRASIDFTSNPVPLTLVK